VTRRVTQIVDSNSNQIWLDFLIHYRASYSSHECCKRNNGQPLSVQELALGEAIKLCCLSTAGVESFLLENSQGRRTGVSLSKATPDFVFLPLPEGILCESQSFFALTISTIRSRSDCPLDDCNKELIAG